MDRVILRCLAACVLFVACSADNQADRPEARLEWPDALTPPNQRALAFVDHRMELSGRGETVILEDLLNVTEATQADPAFAAWSTDGRFVAYIRSSFWSAENPDTIVPEGATLVMVDTRTGDRVERPANTHDALIFSDDVLVVSTDEGIATLDPGSGEQLSEVRTSNPVGRFLGVTSAGLVSARVAGSLLRHQQWSTAVFLVQLDGSEQYVSSIDHDGDEVAALAYDPVSMTFAMATKVPPPGVTDPNMCEPDARVATVPLGSPTLTDIPLPPAPDGRRWQATSLYYRIDGTLVVELSDYPLDCDTGDWLEGHHWFLLQDGQFVPMTDPQEIEQAPVAAYPYQLSIPLVWNNDQRHRASLTAEDTYQPPTPQVSHRLDRRVEDFFTAWLADDLETMQTMASDDTLEALGTPPGIRFDLLWDDTCLMGSSGSGACTVLIFADDGSNPATYTVLYSESGDDISIDAVTKDQ